MEWLYSQGNVSENSLNPECLKKYKNPNDKYQCMFAQNNVDALYKEIKFLSFQSRFDRWQLQNELMNITNQSGNMYGDEMTNYYLQNYMDANNSAQHTAFFDSCFRHCGAWQQIYIDGIMQTELMVNWYYNNLTHSNLYFQNDTYPCDSCCS